MLACLRAWLQRLPAAVVVGCHGSDAKYCVCPAGDFAALESICLCRNAVSNVRNFIAGTLPAH